MADEFVDFYEALKLPLEADRTEVRKRINEVYVDAQRNLDHRNFQTRVKHQEMFEVVLPRARYILLDEGRRDEYDRLVRAFRAASAPAPQVTPPPKPPQEKSFGSGDASGFRLAEVEEPAGKAPTVEALPDTQLDPAQMAVQRDEMWAKWKQGLESAIPHEEDAPKPVKPSPIRASSPIVSTQTAPSPASAQVQENTEPQRRPRPQAAPISFNFENGSNAPSPDDDEDTIKAKKAELERQKVERKRVVMLEILDGISLKGTIIGALGAAIPLGTLLIFLMGRYYPREGGPQLPLPSTAAWVLGLIIVVGAAVVAAIQLSKTMRNQAALQLSMLPLEELLRKVGRTY
ncbi:hypothetical protein EON83_17595 [bacterium]|nr:MAG: hypothetical protein EON83_17595 [bacterium]